MASNPGETLDRPATDSRRDEKQGLPFESRVLLWALATGLPGGIGLPHARSQHVTMPSIAVGVTKYGHALDFGAHDGPANVVLLIATPAASFSAHLEVLADLARSLSKEGYRESLRRANDADIISELINSSLVFADH